MVNLLSRLEGLTKPFGVEVIMDDVTASALRLCMSLGNSRIRRLAKVRPSGIQSSLEIHELAWLANGDGEQGIEASHVINTRSTGGFYCGRWQQSPHSYFPNRSRSAQSDVTLLYGKIEHGCSDHWDGLWISQSFRIAIEQDFYGFIPSHR